MGAGQGQARRVVRLGALALGETGAIAVFSSCRTHAERDACADHRTTNASNPSNVVDEGNGVLLRVAAVDAQGPDAGRISKEAA